jgi:hypothetical protein
MHNVKQWYAAAEEIDSDPQKVKQIVELCYTVYVAGMNNGKQITMDQYHQTFSNQRSDQHDYQNKV